LDKKGACKLPIHPVLSEILNRLIDDLEGFLGFLLWTYRSFYFFSSSLFCELG
jgi:hypothetical protein